MSSRHHPIGERELQLIISALDWALGRAPKPPEEPEEPVPPAEETASDLGAVLEAEAAEPAPGPPPELESSYQIPDTLIFEAPPLQTPPPLPRQAAPPPAGKSLSLNPLPERELILPPSIVPAPAKGPALPCDDIPKDARANQIRRVAVICTEEAADEIAELMSHLQGIGRAMARPLYLRTSTVQTVDESSNPATVVVQAGLADSDAAVAVLKGLSDPQREGLAAAMAKKRLKYHQVEPEDIQDRQILVEIMIDMLVYDPAARANNYGWEDRGHDADHGFKR